MKLIVLAVFLTASTLSAQDKPKVNERELYPLGPDSQPQEGVPKGTVTKYHWTSLIFAKTERDYWVYVPAQYDKDKPTALMVFQDGGGYIGEKGSSRVPIVFDNLISKKEIPVMIGIFINPGTFPPEKEGGKPVSNRSFEYDSMSDQYSRFLLEEILPEVGKTLNLSNDPKDRGISGSSSGGICAFTVAWERPNEFSKVLSWVGSFTNIRGGHNYEASIRKTPPKPIRVFLQDGANDLDNEHGNWPLANQQMYASLKYKKYDVKFVFGEGVHSGIHGGAILPDSLRWLWRPVDGK
jgi:enterochelin esterase family protein